eukprot:scaffold197128_cov40-Tisochrysis_lutea.AAC.1
MNPLWADLWPMEQARVQYNPQHIQRHYECTTPDIVEECAQYLKTKIHTTLGISKGFPPILARS